MDWGLKDAQKVSIKQDSVDIVNRLTLHYELGTILIKVDVHLIDVAIFLDCVLCELMKVGHKVSNSSLAIKIGSPHHFLVHERCNYIRFVIYGDYVILLIGKQGGFGLLGKAVVQTSSHVFVVLCSSLVCSDACNEDEELTTFFECVSINLAIFSHDVDLSSVTICELRMFWDLLSHPILFSLSCTSFSKITTWLP